MTPAIVTIGNFDGVHRGHQHVIGQAVQRARALGLSTFAVTFFPHPDLVLHPERSLAYLTDPEEKVWLIRRLGVDDVWVCTFTRELSRLSADEFMAMVQERHPIAELWVGSDFALGRGRSGTLSVLAEIGAVQGYGAHVVPPLRVDGVVVSSTLVRGSLAEGDMPRARHMLGRPYSVCGEAQGDADGGCLVRVAGDRAIPCAGLYAAHVRLGDAMAGALVEVTPSEDGLTESHLLSVRLLDSEQALPARVAIAFAERIRPAESPRYDVGRLDVEAARKALRETVQLGDLYEPC